MKKATGPFLEYSFYFDIKEQEEAKTFARIIAVLLNHGATFAGRGYAHRDRGVQNLHFADITEDPLEEIQIHTLDDLTAHLENPDTRVIQVQMIDASGTGQGVEETVTYLSISENAVSLDHHPFAIWTSGGHVSGPEGYLEEYLEESARVGRKAYRHFLALVNELRPAYAAITVEEPLECPTDLSIDPRTGAFRDFYISGSFIDAAEIGQIKGLFVEAYQEPVADGLYISTWELLNPEGKSIQGLTAMEKSVEVARLIAKMYGGKKA